MLFRYDGWIKNVLGQALAGAKVYVCNQPANTVQAVDKFNVPIPTWVPSPLASIASNTSGTPLSQPLFTDGFGHFDFYVGTGLYTLVIMLNNRVFQVYPDQAPMQGGAGITEVQTNEVPNGDQALLDLHAGANISLVDNGAGRVTIAATGILSPLSLETNGVLNSSQALLDLHSGSGVTATDIGGGVVRFDATQQLTLQTDETPNGSQSLLDLHAGTNISLTDNGSGRVTVGVSGLVSAANISTADQGYFMPPTLTLPSGGGSTNPIILAVDTVGTVYGISFVLPFRVTVRRVTIYFSSAGIATATTGHFGIYSADGSTLLVHTSFLYGSQTPNSGNTNTISDVVLEPGAYLFAWGQDTNNAASVLGCISTYSSSSEIARALNAGTIKKCFVKGSNFIASGSLPSSFGTRTDIAASSLSAYPIVVMEP